MIGVSVDGGEGDGLGEGLFEELIRELPDLVIGGRHIKREFDFIVSASSLGLFELLFGAKIGAEVIDLFFEPNLPIIGVDVRKWLVKDQCLKELPIVLLDVGRGPGAS